MSTVAHGNSVEWILRGFAILLVIMAIGLIFGGARLSIAFGFDLEQPAFWSSRFPERGLVRTAIHRDIVLGTGCEKVPDNGSTARPSKISPYGHVLPNEPSVLVDLARLARECDRGSLVAPLVRRALALGNSDVDIVINSYRFRRFFGYRDPELADMLDQKLAYFWGEIPSVRRDISEMIGRCWSCQNLLKKAAPDFYLEVEAFGRR